MMGAPSATVPAGRQARGRRGGREERERGREGREGGKKEEERERRQKEQHASNSQEGLGQGQRSVYLEQISVFLDIGLWLVCL